MAQTPTDPTKAQAWITGTAPNQSIEFYFPNGPKGDPGGIAYGTDLLATDLNTIVTTGVYRTTTTYDALHNYPVALPGVLVVYERFRDATYQSVFQEYQVADSANGARVIYRRYFYGNATWTPWRALTSTRVDQTAGRVIYQWDDLNNREQITYGDTGIRNIDTLFSATGKAAKSSTDTPTLRRVGQMVELTLPGYNMTTGGMAAPTGQLVMSPWPAGFKPLVGPHFYPSIVSGTGLSAGFINCHDGGLYIGATNTGQADRAQAMWFTADAWPTTLPGVAVGSIPNV